MINKDQAKLLASEKLKELETQSKIALDLLDESTIEFAYGWVFFYQSEEYIRTGDLNKLIGGNAPIIVDKLNSSVIITGTRRDSQYYIDNYCLYRDDIKKYKDVIS